MSCPCDKSSSQTISKAKLAMGKKEIKTALMYIAGHLKIMKVKLETVGLTLTASVQIIEAVHNSLKCCGRVCDGYNYLTNLVNIYRGENVSNFD